MRQQEEMRASHRDGQSWLDWATRRVLEKMREGEKHGLGISEAIKEPQTLEEVLEAIRSWWSNKLPAVSFSPGYSRICWAAIEGLKERYLEMSGDAELDPELSGKELYQYFDSKYGWSAEDEREKEKRRERVHNIQTGFRIRMILGPLVQGMAPEGYKEELRKLGWYKTYREELRQFGWNEEQIAAFINDLMMVH